MQEYPRKKMFTSSLNKIYFNFLPEKCKISVDFLHSALNSFDNSHYLVLINLVFDELSFGINSLVALFEIIALHP